MRSARPRATTQPSAFLLCLAAALLGLALIAAPAAALPSGNLLANPGGEVPPTVEGEFLGGPAGWTQLATLSPPGDQTPFDSCYGGSTVEEAFVRETALESSVGEAIGGGARFLFAGYYNLSELAQEVAVGPEAYGRTLLLGGDFGGWLYQEDHASLAARFLDGGGAELGEIATAPVTAADREGRTALLPRAASGPVPTGTATIRFVLTQTREEGLSNDGYADNLYATFDASAPAPPAAAYDADCPLRTSQPQEPAPSSPAPAPAPAPAPSAPAPAPAVKITSSPPREGAGTTAVFAFTGTPGGSYECSLDGGPWKPCASGHDFGPARPGDHRFQVREKLGGKTSAPASYRWTVDLPRQCVLRVARARVFAYATKSKARLVIHYTSYAPARVTVAYSLAGKKGKLTLGSASSRFQKAGVFRLPVRLTATQLAKLRAARSFTVRFKIPKAPQSCGRYYTKRLTIPKKVSGQTVWFQSDSKFAPGG
jgi:hypothetical protein